MRIEDFTPIFEHRQPSYPPIITILCSWQHCRKRLLPKAADLSFYNWETQLSTSNSTPHYQVIADSAQGLLFKNKRDRKVVNVNPETDPGDNTTRVEIETSEYTQVVLYDHSTRRRL
jgi:hypothetical protein